MTNELNRVHEAEGDDRDSVIQDSASEKRTEMSEAGE